jgi:LemA protein
MNTSYILIGIVVLLVLYVWSTYNNLVVLKARIKEALSGIDVQLKRRIDLIPNLIETVKGYAKHEKQIFEDVTKARSEMMKAGNVSDKLKANDQMTGALKSIFALAENYPNLKANENFAELQRQLEDTEDKIAYSRQFFNANILDYNTSIVTFPNSIIANNFGFAQEKFFEATEEERKKVDVKF